MSEYGFGFGWPHVRIVCSTDSDHVTTILLVTVNEELADDFVKALKTADPPENYRYTVERKPVMR